MLTAVNEIAAEQNNGTKNTAKSRTSIELLLYPS